MRTNGTDTIQAAEERDARTVASESEAIRRQQLQETREEREDDR